MNKHHGEHYWMKLREQNLHSWLDLDDQSLHVLRTRHPGRDTRTRGVRVRTHRERDARDRGPDA